VKGKIWFVAVAMALVMCFSLVGHAEEKKAEAQKGAQAPSPPPEVEVAEVMQEEIPVFQEFVGTMDGLTNATILAQVQGYLIKQAYKEGSFVKKGDLLFEIDPRPFQASLDVVKAVLTRYEAVLRTDRATLERILPLAEINAVSQKDKDDAIGRVDAAEAQVLAARADVRKAELDLGFTRIISPIDGIAGAAKAQIGDLVGPPQSQVLTTVSAVNPIKVYMPISERDYMKAVERGKARGPEEGGIKFNVVLVDGTTWPHQGTLGFADRQVDPQTGTIRVAILFPNPENILRPGQYAKVKALIKMEKAALMVPQRAVGELQGIYRVAVVDTDNTVKIRNVTVGERIGTNWVIRDGLKPGERVVAEGIQKVREGLKVSPKPYAAKP